MRVPDIYIIGAQKSGTTTLYDWLSQHPQIHGHYLAKDYPFFSNDRAYQDGPAQFHAFVRDTPPNRLALGGDANAMYAPSGVQRMYEIMPTACLIAILRDPVIRAYSAYTHAVERLMEERTLEQAIGEELKGMRYKPLDAAQRDYLAHGHYAKQLREVLRFFPQDRVKIVIFEEFRHEPQNVMTDIFHSLGVVENFVPDMTIRNETQGGYRSKWLAKLAYAYPSSQILRKFGKALIPFSVRTTIRNKLAAFNRVAAPKPEFPEAVRAILKEYYQKEITALENLLGRRIDIWHER